MSKKEKATREYLETLTKDRVIELCLQFIFDVEVTEQQLKETKDEIDLYKKFVSGGTIEEVIEAVWRKREIDQLKQQLEEKQKTIDEINKEFVQAVHDWKALCKKKDKEIERLKQITIFKDSRNMTTKINGVDFSDEQIIILQNLDVLKKYDQTQLAIQELEKVKMQLKDKTKMMSNEEHCYQRKVVSWFDICDQINNQIKELKGE